MSCATHVLCYHLHDDVEHLVGDGLLVDADKFDGLRVDFEGSEEALGGLDVELRALGKENLALLHRLHEAVVEREEFSISISARYAPNPDR